MMTPARNERGAALIVAIVFLMVLTILMAVLHRTTLYEMFSSRHYQESQHAFYAADTGVRRALAWFGRQSAVPMHSSATPWVYDTAGIDPDAATWSSAESCGEDGTCRYYVEFLKDAPNYDSSAKIGTRSGAARGTLYYFRITSEGISRNGLVSKRVQVVTTAAF